MTERNDDAHPGKMHIYNARGFCWCGVHRDDGLAEAIAKGLKKARVSGIFDYDDGPRRIFFDLRDVKIEAALDAEAGGAEPRGASFLMGRLFEFYRMQRDRPIDPCYWDKHEENEMKEELAEIQKRVVEEKGNYVIRDFEEWWAKNSAREFTATKELCKEAWQAAVMTNPSQPSLTEQIEKLRGVVEKLLTEIEGCCDSYHEKEIANVRAVLDLVKKAEGKA